MSPQRHKAVLHTGILGRRHRLKTQVLRSAGDRAARTRARVVIRHTEAVAFSYTS